MTNRKSTKTNKEQEYEIKITNITMVGAMPQCGVQSALGITNQIQY